MKKLAAIGHVCSLEFAQEKDAVVAVGFGATNSTETTMRLSRGLYTAPTALTHDLLSPDICIHRGSAMIEPYRIRNMRDQYEKACKQRAVLLECLNDAEYELEKLTAIIAEHEKHGRQFECDALEHKYHQLQINCAHLVRQISDVEGPLEKLEMTLRGVDDYFRDSGVYPGLKSRQGTTNARRLRQ